MRKQDPRDQIHLVQTDSLQRRSLSLRGRLSHHNVRVKVERGHSESHS